MNARYYLRREADMRRNIRAILVAMAVTAAVTAARAQTATNIILFIGDGMGVEHVKAGRMFKGANLVFETWPYRGECMTRSASSSVTDSAASSTAMATGQKVNNGVISVMLPGNGQEIETVLEHFRSLGKRTGLVTTTSITHATPAGFGAHEASRGNTPGIASDYLNQTRPNVLYGGGGAGMTWAAAVAAGYTVVTDRVSMQALNPATVTNVSGQFGVGEMPFESDGMGALPRLAEMTASALSILENATNGFFLMVEGGRIDRAAHGNDIARCIGETIGFDDAIRFVATWATNGTDTLMLVTADHETGGLTVLADNGSNVLPTVSWSTGGHTAANVGVYAMGPGAERVAETNDNTDIYRILRYATVDVRPAVATSAQPASGAGIQWEVRPGDVYTLQSKDVLGEAKWTHVTTLTATQWFVETTDTNPPAGPSRFYRLNAER